MADPRPVGVRKVTPEEEVTVTVRFRASFTHYHDGSVGGTARDMQTGETIGINSPNEKQARHDLVWAVLEHTARVMKDEAPDGAYVGGPNG